MAKLLYSAAMSLDGFIAGPGGDMSWLTAYVAPDPDIDDLIAEIGALLVGRRTYRGDDPHRGTDKEGKPFGGGWDGPQFVLTHSRAGTAPAGVTFVADLGTGVAAAKAAAGQHYVNVLGAGVARQCLDAGLLDEIFVTVVPVLLGDGVRLFTRSNGAPIGLELIGRTSRTNLRYRVLPPGRRAG